MQINIAMIILLIGILTFTVNVIVEITKGVYPLNQVHTNYYVVGLSLMLSILSYFIYLSYSKAAFIWYYLVAAIVIGFIVAYCAMFGWEKLIKLYQESTKGSVNNGKH